MGRRRGTGCSAGDAPARLLGLQVAVRRRGGPALPPAGGGAGQHGGVRQRPAGLQHRPHRPRYPARPRPRPPRHHPRTCMRGLQCMTSLSWLTAGTMVPPRASSDLRVTGRAYCLVGTEGQQGDTGGGRRSLGLVEMPGCARRMQGRHQPFFWPPCCFQTRTRASLASASPRSLDDGHSRTGNGTKVPCGRAHMCRVGVRFRAHLLI